MKNRFIVILSFVLCLNFVVFQPVAMANATTMGGWSQVGQVIRDGATSVYNGIKKTVENGIEKVEYGVSRIKPAVSDVSKFMINMGSRVVGMAAVTTALDMLLDGVDYVLDPANNTITYKADIKKGADGQYYAVGDLLERARQICAKNNQPFTSNGKIARGVNAKPGHVAIYCNPNNAPDVPVDKKSVPIDVVAEQVINNADKKDKVAVDFVGEVASAVATTAKKEQDWERTKAPTLPQAQANARTQTIPDTQDDTKAPAVPTTGADTANPAKDDTSTQNPPNTANPDKPSDDIFELPAFCGWAPVVCETLSKIAKLPDTLSKWVESAKEWVKEFFKPKDEKTEIDIEVSDNNKPDTNIRFNGLCPAPVTLIDMNFFGSRIYHQFTYDKFCGMLQNLRPIIIAVGSFIAVLIVGGVRTKDE